MKVLIYGNRKQSDMIYDISTPEKEAAAYLDIFNMLDKDWEVYIDLEDDFVVTICEPCQKDLHKYCDGDKYHGDSGNITHCGCEGSEECKKKSEKIKTESYCLAKQIKWYNLAKSGDAKAAISLLKYRSSKGYEYEIIRTDTILNPLGL